MNVAEKREQVPVRLDRLAPEPPLEQVPCPVVPSVEATRIADGDPLHNGLYADAAVHDEQVHVV